MSSDDQDLDQVEARLGQELAEATRVLLEYAHTREGRGLVEAQQTRLLLMLRMVEFQRTMRALRRLEASR